MNERVVVIDAEQAQILEELGERLMREHDERAFKVLAVSLAYRYAKPSFECDVDESAGLAEVVDLRERIAAYSKKVS